MIRTKLVENRILTEALVKRLKIFIVRTQKTNVENENVKSGSV